MRGVATEEVVGETGLSLHCGGKAENASRNRSSYARSELVRLEWSGTARAVLLQRFISQVLEGARLLRERGVPEPVGLHLFKDGRRQGVLVCGRELGRRFESLLQLAGHGTNLWEESSPNQV